MRLSEELERIVAAGRRPRRPRSEEQESGGRPDGDPPPGEPASADTPQRDDA